MSPILIQPDNRLLGWSTSDLSQYGAQPLPGMSIGRPSSARDDTEGKAFEQGDTAHSSPDQPPPDFAAPPASPAEHPAAPTEAGASAPAVLLSVAPVEHGGVAEAPALHTVSLTAPIFLASNDVAGSHPASHQAPAAAPDTAPLVADGPSFAFDSIQPDFHALEGLAGANPAAGIGTILDLMKTADIFELKGATTLVEHDVTPVIDTLAFDITDGAPLLGDIAHHDDGLLGSVGNIGGVIDTHHGLGGL